MSPSETNRPTKWGWGFLAVYLLLFALMLGFFPPWKWQQRLITDVIGALLFPFLVSTAVYYTSLFVLAIATNLPGGLRGMASFSIEVAALLVAMAALCTFPSLRNAPFCLAVASAILAGALMNWVFRTKPSHPSTTSLGPLAAPAGRDLRRP
jgi:hypothetical protein